jgi:hypothetical protein
MLKAKYPIQHEELSNKIEKSFLDDWTHNRHLKTNEFNSSELLLWQLLLQF